MKTASQPLITALGQLIFGIQKHQPNGAFPVDGENVTATVAVAKLQSIINALVALLAAHAALKEAVMKADALVQGNRAFVRDIRTGIQMLYASSAATLGDFGLAPRKRRALTVEEKALRAAKAAATRKARHTMGSKQKALITGDVTGLTLTPVLVPTPLPATSPAAAPSGGVTPPTVGVVVPGTTATRT